MTDLPTTITHLLVQTCLHGQRALAACDHTNPLLITLKNGTVDWTLITPMSAHNQTALLHAITPTLQHLQEVWATYCAQTPLLAEHYQFCASQTAKEFLGIWVDIADQETTTFSPNALAQFTNLLTHMTTLGRGTAWHQVNSTLVYTASPDDAVFLTALFFHQDTLQTMLPQLCETAVKIRPTPALRDRLEALL